MASMLLRASRGAARAAHLAASAASRCAAVAASGSGGAAASNRLLCTFPIASRPFGRALSSDRGDFRAAAPSDFNLPDPGPGEEKFVADAKDLESDEALWALYERWCKAFGEKRDQDEMRRRFNKFKYTVLFVDRANKEAIRNGESVRFAINPMADGKRRELMINHMPLPEFAVRLPPNTQIFMSAGNLEEADSLPNPFCLNSHHL